jgi:hypothetical protein
MAQEAATDLEHRLAQAQRELSESLERQAATDEVLSRVRPAGTGLERSGRWDRGISASCRCRFQSRQLSSGLARCAARARGGFARTKYFVNFSGYCSSKIMARRRLQSMPH